MKEIGRSNGYAIDRIYYEAADGSIISKALEQDVSAIIEHNKQMAHDFRPHQKGECRVVAEVPVTLYYKWLVEEQVPGWCTEDALEGILMKKLADPQYKYVLTVPEDYRIKKNV